jgi:cation/acetate symporter
MLSGLGFTATTIALIRSPQIFGTAEPLITDSFGVKAQGAGTIGMFINFAVTVAVSLVTPPPPHGVQEMVEGIRYPRVRSASERVDTVT